MGRIIDGGDWKYSGVTFKSWKPYADGQCEVNTVPATHTYRSIPSGQNFSSFTFSRDYHITGSFTRSRATTPILDSFGKATGVTSQTNFTALHPSESCPNPGGSEGTFSPVTYLTGPNYSIPFTTISIAATLSTGVYSRSGGAGATEAFEDAYPAKWEIAGSGSSGGSVNLGAAVETESNLLLSGYSTHLGKEITAAYPASMGAPAWEFTDAGDYVDEITGMNDNSLYSFLDPPTPGKNYRHWSGNGQVEAPFISTPVWVGSDTDPLSSGVFGTMLTALSSGTTVVNLTNPEFDYVWLWSSTFSGSSFRDTGLTLGAAIPDFEEAMDTALPAAPGASDFEYLRTTLGYRLREYDSNGRQHLAGVSQINLGAYQEAGITSYRGRAPATFSGSGGQQWLVWNQIEVSEAYPHNVVEV